MILELGDGRELKLPDDMLDETARQLKQLILTLEGRAFTAESQARTLRDEMAALRQQFNNIQAAPPAEVQLTPVAYWDSMMGQRQVEKKRKKSDDYMLLLLG
jgi:hypothetical protein